ncbi:UNVERIFIED_CONTAM: decapping endonuclease targeting mRNA [Siphonaria sp. JEL0065]|nr:decapping endonuclease targeting mRNA [Siphonaria sp. JEL0065]
MKRNHQDDYPNESKRHHNESYHAPTPLTTISISPVSRFQRNPTKSAAFRQPKEVACFSYTAQRNLLVNNLSALKFYHPIKLDGRSNDLSTGFRDRYIARESAIENLDSMLEALKIPASGGEDGSEGSLLTVADRGDGRPRFCTWRGIMTKIFVAPYSTDTWELRATLHKGTLYIMEDPVTSRPTSTFNESTKGKLMTYWGYSFENLSTLDTDPRFISPNDLIQQERKRVDHGVVDTHVQFCSIVKTRVGAHDVFMGAEVDCLMTNDEPPTQKPLPSPIPPEIRQPLYAELKTNRTLTHANHTATFHKNKILKTYFQCFLAGIPKVIVGFRDDRGFVESTRVYKTLEMPRMVREAAHGEAVWDPVVCINWADEVLAVIWKTLNRANAVLDEGTRTNQVVYRIKMKGQGDGNGGGWGNRNNVQLVNEGGFIEIQEGVIDPILSFVPE